MKINSIIDLVKDLDTSRQTKNLNKLLIRILLHLQVEFSVYYIKLMTETNRIEYKRELTPDLDIEKEVVASFYETTFARYVYM